METPSNPHRQTLVLIDQARAGDPRATSALFELYQGRVMYMVRTRLSERLRNRVETMDLVQETLATAFARIKEFDPKGSGAFYVWMREIVKRKISEEIKRQSALKRKDSREVPIDAGGPDDSGSGRCDPVMSSLHLASILDRQAAVQRLEEHIEALKPDQREALQLWYFEGLKPAQIAERMDRSADACRMMVGRALKTLGRKFKESAAANGV